MVCDANLRGSSTRCRTTEPEVRDVDRYHLLFVDRKEFFVPHIRPSPGRECNTLYGNIVKDILRRSEPSRRFHMVVVSPKEKIRPEVKVLFATVAGDLCRERNTGSAPGVRPFLPRSDLLRAKSLHGKQTGRRQIGPKHPMPHLWIYLLRAPLGHHKLHTRSRRPRDGRTTVCHEAMSSENCL